MPEVWGGVECTVTRLDDRTCDQLERTGHPSRCDDIDRFADLGIRRLRFPILWERIERDGPDAPQWSSVDAHLDRARERGVVPIAGLLHHGTGPRHADITGDDFPRQFAEYAGRVARRFPWIEWWTPINEPVTTARFCGLYGHWYPHAQSDTAFVRLLRLQCEASLRAMQAIRSVIPDAKFMHTEDVGRIVSTRAIAYQATFENHRQRLALDLLTGRVTSAHALWPYLANAGMTAVQRDWFQARRQQPDVIAADYYMSSDRYLDSDVQRHPPESHGGNGRHVYADVALSERHDWCPRLDDALIDLWEEYGSAVAVGEVHLNGGVDAQLQWANTLWTQANRISARGIPVAGVTFWALLGAHNWSSLLRMEGDQYESGAFDLTSGTPQPTRVAEFIRTLAARQLRESEQQLIRSRTEGAFGDTASLSSSRRQAGAPRERAIPGVIAHRDAHTVRHPTTSRMLI